jgi:hypothetical protein
MIARCPCRSKPRRTSRPRRSLLDEEDITNGPGLSLTEWLGDEDAEQLRRILSRITGPEGPTFTTPHC